MIRVARNNSIFSTDPPCIQLESHGFEVAKEREGVVIHVVYRVPRLTARVIKVEKSAQYLRIQNL